MTNFLTLPGDAPASPRLPLLGDLTLADLDLLRRLNSEDHLLDFIRVCWHTVEPSRNFIQGWAIEAVAEHLEAVANGHINRLIINLPPGAMKSLLSQVFLPAWLWGPKNRPELRFMCASYSAALTERDNGRTCQLIHSGTYKKFWGDRFSANESRVKVSNDRTGWKLATSVGGVGTGERADVIVIDDALSVKEANSKVIRDTMRLWLRETMPTRLNDPVRSSIIVIEQRTHEEDATGTLLSDGGDWELLMIPMEWDGRRYTTSLGWTDPRTIEDTDPASQSREWWRVRGELYFPERFPIQVVERDKMAMGTVAVAGQFQQTPVPRGGGIIQRDWWQYWGPADPTEPAFLARHPGGLKFPPFQLVIGWYDGAYTAKTENDPSALAIVGLFNDEYQNPGDPTHQPTGAPKAMIAYSWAAHVAINDAVRELDRLCRKYTVSLLLVENKAQGISVVQELHRLFQKKPYSVVEVNASGQRRGGRGDKVARATAVAPLWEAGCVWIPHYDAKDWARAAIDEVSMFPRGARDDRTDTLIGAIGWLRDNGMLLTESEWHGRERAIAEDEDAQLRYESLYRT